MVGWPGGMTTSRDAVAALHVAVDACNVGLSSSAAALP